MHGLAVFYGDRLDKTVSGAGAAAPAVIGNLDGQSFQTGKYSIELVGRDVPVIGHHTTAGAAKADAQEFFFIRDEEGKVIEPHLADERDQAGVQRLLKVLQGLRRVHAAADLGRHLQSAFTHEKASDVKRVILAVPCRTA